MRIKPLLFLFVSLLLVVTARAQMTASVTANPTSYATSGGAVTLTVAVNYPRDSAITALGVTLTLPNGWTYVTRGGPDFPQITPSAGAAPTLEFAYTSWPETGVSFSVTVVYPSELTGPQAVKTQAFVRMNSQLTYIPVADTVLLSGATGSSAPAIVTQPANVTVTVGQTIGLSVVATGTAPLTYQWRKGGTALSGRTTAALSLSNAATTDAGTYDVVVSNPIGSITSSAATVIVNPPVANIGPSIVTQPTSVTVTEGQSTGLFVIASGSAPLFYQWRKGGSPLAGATNSSLTFPSVTAANAGTYDVIVTNSVDAAVSRTATVTVNPLVPAAPVIVTQPSGRITTVGSTVTLTVAATSATPLSYQWRKDGANLASATNSSLVLAGATAVSGTYSVVVTNTGGSTTSANAVVQFTDNPTVAKPVITQQPRPQAVLAGGSVTFSVSAFGPGPLKYQWFRDGGAILEETAAQLTINPVPRVSSTYSVEVSNAGGRAMSMGALLTVIQRTMAPTITQQPSAQTALAGERVTFAVTAAGNPAPKYQWRKNGTLLTGMTNATLVLTSVQLEDAAGYDVVVDNTDGAATSSLAQLTVASAPVAPVVLRQPADLTRALGLSGALAVVASGAPAPVYQWRKDGTAVAGATGATLSFASLRAADAGTYTVVVSNSAGSVTSAPVVVAVPARGYAGTWFGTFAGGSFALQIGEDNRGTFLAFATGSRTAYVSRAAAVDETGRFRLTATVTSSGPASAGAPLADFSAPTPAPATEELVFTGTIADDGSLTGASSGSPALSLFAPATPTPSSTASFAGFYTAGAAGGSTQLLSIVNPAGQVFMLVAGAAADAAVGTLDALGRLTTLTTGQQAVAAAFLIENGGVQVRLTDTKGVATNFAGFAAASAPRAEQRFINISTRTTAGTGDQVAIVGFVIAGLEAKTVLLRAVGPTLTGFGVGGVLGAPRLELNRGSTVLGVNTGWSNAANSAAIAAAATRAGAFPLGAASADSSMLVTLAPGQYSAVVSAADGRPGVTLVEIYDLSGASLDQKLVNISARASAGSGDATLIAGLVVGGSAPKRVLVRAAGPTLAQFGVTGVLARPQLTIVASDGAIVAQNAGWSTAADPAGIAETASGVGAFSFPAGSQDAAILLNLAPGAYTAQVAGLGGTTGTVLIEGYEVP